MPDKPTPIPTEIKTQFTESLWRSFAWKKTRWLGNRVRGLPSDLFVYQEILHDVRPDWIVEIGTDGGGRTMFLATICDMLGHGRIISVDEPGRTGEEHDRITYLEGRPMSREIVSRVEELVGTPPKAMVILGKREPANRTVRQFDLYSPLVPAGSYLVIEETIVNGHPVWAKFGPGPMEAVKRITNRRGDFAPDHGLEKYGVTFHPHGFLRRLPDT